MKILFHATVAKMLIPKTKFQQDCFGDVCQIKRVSDGIGIDNV